MSLRFTAAIDQDGNPYKAVTIACDGRNGNTPCIYTYPIAFAIEDNALRCAYKNGWRGNEDETYCPLHAVPSKQPKLPRLRKGKAEKDLSVQDL